MSTIQDITCEALKAAHGDLVKARRMLLIAAGLLALIHLLTVHPYLKASREIAPSEWFNTGGTGPQYKKS